MRRRQALATLGTASIAGCLRLTGSETTTTASTTERDAGTDSGGEGLFAERADAVSYAGQFAAADATPVTETVERSPTLVRHGGGSGTSYGPADGGGTYTSQDIQFESIPDDGVAFGGGTSRTLRVRNATLGKTATFEPAADASRLRVTDWEIDAEAEGRPPSAIGLDGADTDQHVRMSGTWEGDTGLFREQAFGEYVVDVLENGTRIGGTGGRVYGVHYRWGAKQTRDALYVTRQPSTNESWTVALLVGGTPFDPKARQAATHHAEDGVFRVDLSGLDLESGRYPWRLHVTPSASARWPALALIPTSGALLLP